VGAAVTSSSVRKVVRRGVVYGLAGGLIAYDKVAAVASGVVRGARQGMASANGTAASEQTPAGQEGGASTEPAVQTGSPAAS
jgi:hypothetical protein